MAPPPLPPSIGNQRLLRADKPVLRFNDDGSFRISVFSDLHYAEDTNSDKKTTRVLQTILTQEPSPPQLAVLNGDLISGEAVSSHSKPSTYIDQIVSPLVKQGIPWATTHGNHDSEMHLDPEQTFNHEKRYRLSLTRKMVSEPAAGYTNYYLSVYPSRGSNGAGGGGGNDSAPAMILWFFDTRGGHYPIRKTDRQDAVPRPNWVHESVISWFTSTNARLTAEHNRIIPSLAFFHIPTYAVLAYQNHGVDPSMSPGINDERVCQQGYGGGFEYEGQDQPFMQALLKTEGLVATFSGHDHGNDWCFKWTNEHQLPDLNLTGNGINMCYTRHTGYGGYGSWARGGRQILLDQARVGEEVRTWVRLEDGTVSGNMSLGLGLGRSSSEVQRYAVEESAGDLGPSISPGILSSVVSFWVVFVFLFGEIW